MHKIKVCHLTSVHNRNDTRIFMKQCRSLANHGYEVALVVADGKGDESNDGVAIHDVGKPENRIRRMAFFTKRVLHKALEIDAEVYQLHDPELIPAGLKLKGKGKKVIFDSHEDVPKQLFSKPYLNRPVRWIISKMFGLYETRTCIRFDAIIAATPTIREKFLLINDNTIDINNFPFLEELVDSSTDWSFKKSQVCYIGGLSEIRGIRELVMAMPKVTGSVRLVIGGSFSESAFEREIKSLPAWNRVDELGFLDRPAVKNVLSESLAGLVVLHPIMNYLDSLPVKMFEYMSAGIPVIASNFPLWRTIVETNNCGICVDPLDPGEIAAAIDYIAYHRPEAREMGQNGRKAVENLFNWNNEERKLIGLYNNVINKAVKSTSVKIQ